MTEFAAFDAVFGKDSKGSTPSARAQSSTQIFVRSQVQITHDNPDATGHRMRAEEALRLYGWDVLKNIAEDGAAVLALGRDEPAHTLRTAREDLNLTIETVAKRANTTSEIVQAAETPGKLTHILLLERIAASLGLNEHFIAFRRGAGGNHKLMVRLREFTDSANGKDAKHFSTSEVFGLAEAAWITARQSELEKLVGKPVDLKAYGFENDSDYSYPSYMVGQRLAHQTRNNLGLYYNEPIESLRTLLEDRLGIPLMQSQLGKKFAGATISDGKYRGVVVNETGQNSSVLTRRMTMAHELGHLLWDTDVSLNLLKVDRYDELESDVRSEKTTDRVEIRANAFAVYFLAPPDGVKKIVEDARRDPVVSVNEVSRTYGIGLAATKYHINNITQLNCAAVTGKQFDPSISGIWAPSENLSVDYFPLGATPLAKRGRFAGLVAKALAKNTISVDTAASYLQCTPVEIQGAAQHLLELIPIAD